MSANAPWLGCSQRPGSCRSSAQRMMARLWSSTWPPGNTSTGTVALGDACSRPWGLLRNTTSRRSQACPLTASASRARMAYGQRRKEYRRAGRSRGLVLLTPSVWERCAGLPVAVRPGAPVPLVCQVHLALALGQRALLFGRARAVAIGAAHAPHIVGDASSLRPVACGTTGKPGGGLVPGRGPRTPARQTQNSRLASGCLAPARFPGT